MLLLLLITPGQNRDKPNFPRFQGNISQEPLKLFNQKTFDFTAGRLSENVKILPQWIYDFCLQQRCTRRVVFKSAIHTTSASLKDLGILHNWPDKHV